MKDIPQSFDAFTFMQAGPQYCKNKDCKEFGYVTMVGIPLEPESDKTEDLSTSKE